MALEQPFSKRNRFAGPKEITIREAAPENLRYFVVQTTIDLGWQPRRLREVICRVLRTTPNPRHRWDSDIQTEVQDLVNDCDWFKVYDLIEVLHASLAQADEYSGEHDAGVSPVTSMNSLLMKASAGRLSMEKSSRAAAKPLKRW
jgi:AbiJ N-terminal domain 4